MSLFRNGSVAAGKRLEVFRETVGIPLYEPGKAGCRSGNGYIPVQSEGRLRERCGKSSGVRLTLHSPENRGGVSFPLVQLLNSILPDHPRVSSDFSRFSGRRKFCPPAPRRALSRISQILVPVSFPDTHYPAWLSRHKILFRLCLIAIITPTSKQHV